MTAKIYDDLNLWQGLCEFLDGQHRKCAYQDAVPAAYRHLVYMGPNASGQAAKAARIQTGLIFYTRGWGWRLHKDWRARLATLRGEYPLQAALPLDAAALEGQGT